VLDCKIIYTVLITERIGNASPEQETPILVTFVKQRAAEQNSHQHSHCMIFFSKFTSIEINIYEALYVC